MNSNEVILLTLATLAIIMCAGQETVKEDFRLPGDIAPIKYTIQIYTSLVETDFSFWGTSTVEIECLADTKQIILHSSGLTITDEEVFVSCTDENDAILYVKIGSIERNDDYEFFIINLDETLVAGNVYIVYLSFSAVLTESSTGYFRSSYVDLVTDETIWFAATFMQAGRARSVFPCWDEPSMKAVFSISLVHTDNLTALSNMPIVNSFYIDGMDDWIMDVFDDTPPMSTYLVAILLSQFDSIEVPGTSVPLRVWGRSDSLDRLQITTEAAFYGLNFFNQYFNYTYPLPKMDVVSVPNYASSMQSLGCIMISEDNTLYDAVTTSIEDVDNIIIAVCGPICHQWVDGLVTFSWWSEVWIAAGFSYYFREFVLDEWFIEETYHDLRFTSKFRSILNDDAFVLYFQPLVTPIDSATNLLQNLSTFTLNKGDAVIQTIHENVVVYHNVPTAYFLIRMMNMILNADVFLHGYRNYLLTYQYGAVTEDDLFNALTQAGINAGTLTADMDMKRIMQTWTEEDGYPVVQVTIDRELGAVYLSQMRFVTQLYFTGNETEQYKNQCWMIPISYTTSAETNFENTLPQVWLTCENVAILFLDTLGENDWLLINLKAMTMIRANYDDTNWQLLQRTLLDAKSYTVIDVMNRMQLVSDSFELAWAGQLAYTVPIGIVPYLLNEVAEQPWTVGLQSMRDLRGRLKINGLLENIDKFVHSFLEPKYSELGALDVFPDNILEKRLKLLIDSMACTFRVEACLNETKNILTAWYNTADPDNENPIDINIRPTVYCYGLLDGDVDLWNFMYDRFLNATDDDEKERILSGLGCPTDVDILQRYLEWSIDSSKIDPQFSSNVLNSVLYHEQVIVFPLIMTFLTDNFQQIVTAFKDNIDDLCMFLYYAEGYLIDTSDQLLQFQTFVDSVRNDISTCQTLIDSGTTLANNYITWHDLHDIELNEIFGLE